MSRNKHKAAAARQQGFTLVELMVVVIIVAILASVAIPSYRSHVVRSNRSSTEAFMMQVANKQEQILFDLRNYVSVANNVAFLNQPTAPSPGLSMSVPPGVSAYYNLAVSAVASTATNPPSPPTFTIVAYPYGPQQVNDTQCQTLTLTQDGAKGQSGGTAPTPTICW